MSYAFCGAHRVGKTTLVKALAEHTGLHLVITSTSAVFQREGVDPAKPMSFETRMRMQNLVLDHVEREWAAAPGMFITDRTPVDMLAYTLADITTEVATTPEEWRELEKYIQRCFLACNAYFSTFILVQPGIPLIADATGKATAALNRSYIEHLNQLMLGALLDSRMKSIRYAIPRDILKLDRRVDYCLRRFIRQQELIGKEMGHNIRH